MPGSISVILWIWDVPSENNTTLYFPQYLPYVAGTVPALLNDSHANMGKVFV